MKAKTNRERRCCLRVPVDALAPGIRLLPHETATYVVRVHRLQPGARFIVFDPALALEADAAVVSIHRNAVEVSIESPRPPSLKPLLDVRLIQALPKADKMDAVVRDATELGVTRISPVVTQRAILRPGMQRLDRWRRIALQAARQCGRADMPQLDSPMPLAQALVSTDPLLGLCLDPVAPHALGPALRTLQRDHQIAVVVGPEGGLTDQELALCEFHGFQRVHLGALTLRTETVCAAVLGALLAAAES